MDHGWLWRRYGGVSATSASGWDCGQSHLARVVPLGQIELRVVQVLLAVGLEDLADPCLALDEPDQRARFPFACRRHDLVLDAGIHVESVEGRLRLRAQVDVVCGEWRVVCHRW